MLVRTMTRLSALGLWLLVAACAAYWGLKLFVRPAPVPPQAGTVASGPALRGDLTRLLGTAPVVEEETTVVAASSRFRLIGVVAPRSPQAAAEGLALIAVDGKPAKAYRVGAAIEGELVLQRVRARGADLGARGAPTAAVALDVAALPPAATGRPGGLPPGAAPGAPRPLPNLAVRPGQPRVSADGNEVVNGENDDGMSDDPPTPAPMRQGLQTQ
jgi:general secretion pathway protein C